MPHIEIGSIPHYYPTKYYNLGIQEFKRYELEELVSLCWYQYECNFKLKKKSFFISPKQINPKAKTKLKI